MSTLELNRNRLQTALDSLLAAYKKLNNTKALRVTEVREALLDIRQANCSVQSLENSLSGVPEVKEG